MKRLELRTMDSYDYRQVLLLELNFQNITLIPVKVANLLIGLHLQQLKYQVQPQMQ